MVSGRTFSMEETERFASSLGGDPARMVANYAGVAVAGDARNDIVIRGNDLQNLTNHQNVYREGLDMAKQEVYTIYQIGFYPMFLYRLRF